LWNETFLYSEVPSSFLVNTMQTLSKSVYNCQSYWQKFRGTFFTAHCVQTMLMLTTVQQHESNIHRVTKRKPPTKLWQEMSQILTDFQNSFTAEKRMNISNKTAYYFPPSSIQQWKNFENWLRFEKVIAKSLVASFLGGTRWINKTVK